MPHETPRCSRRELLAGAAASSLAPGTPAGDGRPNILYIMSDDHAAHAISAYGSRINRTPNIDRLAREGMRFDRCFCTNSICTPSRATLLTGKYSHANGVPVFNTFDGAQPTAPKMLQAAGYHTMMVGKWHLFSNPTGFDDWCILPGQGVYYDPGFITAKGTHQVRGYCTDIITDKALAMLKGRPAGKPFFMMCHHKAPHRSWDPEPSIAADYRKRRIPEPSNLRDGYETRTDAIHQCRQKVFTDLTRRDLKLQPPQGLTQAEQNRWLGVCPDSVEAEIGGRQVTLTGGALDSWKYQRYMQDYLACVESVDRSVGRLLEYLETSGLARNTVVIYASDQGFFLGDHGLYDKRFMYEEALRMPFLVRWPGVTRPGSVQRKLAINPDFAPTFLDIAGLPTPRDMQGRSLRGLMGGRPPADWRTSFYYRYYHDPGDHNTRTHYGVRTETHKLIYFWRLDQWEMYDLRRDPHEMHNIAGKPGERRMEAALRDELYRLKRELGDDDRFADGKV